MLAYGLSVSLLTVFTNRKKRHREKFFMFFFALGSNALLTFYAIYHASAVERAVFGWRDIPLAVSTLYTIAIIGFWNNDLFSEKDVIVDSNATPTQVLFVTIPVVLTALLTTILFRLEWYIAYSWCLTTGFTFKSLATWMFPRPYASH